MMVEKDHESDGKLAGNSGDRQSGERK